MELQFNDLTTKKKETRKPGDIYTIDSLDRLEVLLGKNPRKLKFVEVIEIKKQCPTIYNDNKIVIFQDLLYQIGGIETFVKVWYTIQHTCHSRCGKARVTS